MVIKVVLWLIYTNMSMLKLGVNWGDKWCLSTTWKTKIGNKSNKCTTNVSSLRGRPQNGYRFYINGTTIWKGSDRLQGTCVIIDTIVQLVSRDSHRNGNCWTLHYYLFGIHSVSSKCGFNLSILNAGTISIRTSSLMQMYIYLFIKATIGIHTQWIYEVCITMPDKAVAIVILTSYMYI